MKYKTCYSGKVIIDAYMNLHVHVFEISKSKLFKFNVVLARTLLFSRFGTHFPCVFFEKFIISLLKIILMCEQCFIMIIICVNNP